MSKSRVAITIKSLSIKRSADFTLDIPKLNINKGAMACIVGANGSGKTTLIEAVIGLLEQDSGAVRIGNTKLLASSLEGKQTLGFIPDDDNWIIPELTAYEYLMLLSGLYGSADDRLVRELEVAKLAKKLLFSSFSQQLGSLSHGNKKKVQIIAAMLYRPTVLVVDELRNGLDPIAIKRAEELLQDYSLRGNTVLAATHDLWWAERFADEIIMIKNGRLLLQESKQQIIKTSGSLERKFFELYKDEP